MLWCLPQSWRKAGVLLEQWKKSKIALSVDSVQTMISPARMRVVGALFLPQLVSVCKMPFLTYQVLY